VDEVKGAFTIASRKKKLECQAVLRHMIDWLLVVEARKVAWLQQNDLKSVSGEEAKEVGVASH
jgi:hypothetical protein